VKHENHLPTGAFKVRGGLTYLERCRRERPSIRGLISATRGNHGQSIALAARRYGVPATIVVPRGNNPEKNAAMRAYVCCVFYLAALNRRGGAWFAGGKMSWNTD